MKRVCIPILLALSAALCLPLAATPQNGPDAATKTEPRPRVRDTSRLNREKVDLAFDEVGLRDALKVLFAKVPVNHLYILDPAIEGKISFSAKNIPFEGALVSILRSVERQPLTYGDDGGILLIEPVQSPESGTMDLGNKKLWIDLQNADLRSAFHALLRTIHANFTLEQEVQGTATLKLEGVPLQTALDKLVALGKVPLAYTLEHGLYRIGLKK